MSDHPGKVGSGGVISVLSIREFNQYAAATIAVLTIITLLPKAARVVSSGIRSFRHWLN
jgi:hypothetical protein